MSVIDIQSLLSNIVGVEIDVIEKDYLEGDLPDKVLFCKMIDSWEDGWKTQMNLYNDYHIDVSYYDDYLYYALEKSMLLLYGEEKTKNILFYLYHKGEPNVDNFTPMNSAELYDYINSDSPKIKKRKRKEK